MKKNNTSYGNQTIGSATDSLQSGITSNDVFVTPPKYRKGSSEPLNNYSEGIELTEGFTLNTTLSETQTHDNRTDKPKVGEQVRDETNSTTESPFDWFPRETPNRSGLLFWTLLTIGLVVIIAIVLFTIFKFILFKQG